MVSRRAKRGLKVYFGLFLVYLYLPTLLLVLFAFNSGTLPQFPLSGFTLHWFSAAWNTPALRTAIGNSLLVTPTGERAREPSGCSPPIRSPAAASAGGPRCRRSRSCRSSSPTSCSAGRS